jgi:hypothetical protein
MTNVRNVKSSFLQPWLKPELASPIKGISA